MAIITTGTCLKIGYDQASYIVGSTSVINASTTGVAIPFIADFTGSITRIGIPISTVSTAVTNLDVGIMDSNATGDLPSDTFLATPNTISLSVGGISLTQQTLTNAVSVTRGNVYWIVFKPNASFTGSVTLYITTLLSIQVFSHWRAATRTASTWSRTANAGANAIYGSSTQWYSAYMPIPSENPTAITVSSTTEYGFSVQLDANHPAIRVYGISFMNSLNNAATGGNPGMSYLCKIYNASGTLLYTFETQDTDRINTSNTTGNAYFFNGTTSDIWLEPATKYYIMMAFTGTFTTAPTWQTYPMSATYKEVNGAFTSTYTTKTGSTFTEDSTIILPWHIDIDAIRYNDTGSGGGTFINASPMFNGGFSG
jgi:hypothetical protein